MTFDEILDYVIEHTGHVPYRQLTADDHPEAEGYRRLVRDRYKRLVHPEEFPSLATQAGNAIKAMGRVVNAAMAGQAILVPDEERDRRQGICNACEFFVEQRCSKCGCSGLKLHLTTERCPIGKWEATAS